MENICFIFLVYFFKETIFGEKNINFRAFIVHASELASWRFNRNALSSE